MEREFKFNDEFVSSKIDDLVNVGVQRIIITAEQMQKIREILEIENDSIDEITAKRNSCVKILAAEESKYYNEEKFDRVNFEKYHNTMSGITFVLDSRIWDLRGEC